MNIYFAPLEGITGFVLRNAYESCFPGTIDRYFAPFIAASCRKKLAARDLRDVLPENNTGICLIRSFLQIRERILYPQRRCCISLAIGN